MATEALQIVYLDDSEAQLAYVREAIQRHGHHVTTALTIADARPHIKNADLVIVDYHMPNMTGEEAVTILRAHARTDLPVLFYLYTSDREVGGSFRALGFDGAFVGKGDTTTLGSQLEAAHSLLKLKRFRRGRMAP